MSPGATARISGPSDPPARTRPPDVAHVVHGVAEDRRLQRLPPGHRGRRAGPPGHVLQERVALPVVGEHREPLAPADHRVRGVLGAVHPLVVGHVVHVPGGGDVRLGLDVGQQHRQLGLRQQPGHAHRGPVGEHHDHDPVEVGVLELAHGALGVLAVLDRLTRDELTGVSEMGREFRRVALLALRDARDHVVVEILHDPQDPDTRLAFAHHIPFGRWPYSCVYRRCRASTWSWSSGVSSP